MTLTEQELADIRWMAEFLKAQALAEMKSVAGLYPAYNDRAFVTRDMGAASAKQARCNRVLDALEREVGR